MRVFNSVGRGLRRLGWKRPLNADDVLAGARRRARLDDFGDESFVEPLRVLLESFEEDAELTPLGRLMIRLNCVYYALSRLRVRHALKAIPEIPGQPVRRPVFVVGLPRTGTTLLHNLLCQDPSGRPLLLWEGFQPAPDPHLRPGKKDPRVRQARRLVWLTDRLAPQLRTVHPLGAEEPEECTQLLLCSFLTPAFLLLGRVSGYADWLRGQTPDDVRRTYEDYRSQLQLLQWGGPDGHWVLKSPAHSFGLDAILSLFPDAAVIQTHRNLAQVLPSACSLFGIVRGVYSDAVDPLQLGPELARRLHQGLIDPALRAREAHPGRVFDVSYDALVRDPLGTVRAIYAHFGREMDPEMGPRMERWLAANPANKHGKHHYDLAQFGLTREAVDREFADYQERFGVSAAAAR
jgi:hypothetical protein